MNSFFPVPLHESDSRTRNAVCRFTVALVLLAAAISLRAQSADDGFDPNANGTVRVVVVQPDGKILIGGDFTSVFVPDGDPPDVMRNRIARFTPGGLLDEGFNPNANGTVNSIAVQADGKILVGGAFTSIGGAARNGLARLDPVTGAADSFDPNANGAVNTIAVQADGKIFVGGAFTSICGASRNRIARLDPVTGAADSFDPGASDTVNTITVQADGKVFVGGAFTGIGGATRNRIARLAPATGAADSFDPSANGTVNTIALQVDGKVLAGGAFTSIGGQARNRIARLDAGTGVADSFDPNASGTVNSIVVQSDGKVLAAGAFTTVSPNGGAALARNRVARFERDGLADRTLNDLNSGLIYATANQADGKILIGGKFSSILGVPRANIARLNADGTLDQFFDPGAIGDSRIGAVYAIAVQPDGKILVGGAFYQIGGVARRNIGRLYGNGVVDGFDPSPSDPGGGNGGVYAIAVQPDRRVLVGGEFSNIRGQGRRSFARLDPESGEADSLQLYLDYGDVFAIAVQPDGKILVGGDYFFRGDNERPFSKLGRFDGVTGVADSFYPDPNGTVNTIALQPDGKVLIGGAFSNIGGQPRNQLARLDPATLAADSFNPNAGGGRVNAIAVQSDGKVLVGGQFSSIGGAVRSQIGRIDGTTGSADSFDPYFDREVYSIALQADGKVLAGGAFTLITGVTRRGLARLSNDTAAFGNLAATRSTVTLTRNGSGPQFSRVTFEQSADNGATYTFLGSVTVRSTPPTPSYTLPGLNVLTGQNVLLRARGYYRTGYGNGSESTEERVQTVSLPPQAGIGVFTGASTSAADERTNNVGIHLFPDTAVNIPSAQTFTIKNVGIRDLTGLALAKSGANPGDFTLSAIGATTLAPGASLTFTVTFAPGAIGARSATVQIASNDLNENPFRINLSGTGFIPQLTIDQPTGTGVPNGGGKDFGQVQVGVGTPLIFTVRNPGQGELILSGTPRVAVSGTNAADFTVTTQPGPVLGSGDPVNVTNGGFELPVLPAGRGSNTALGWDVGSSAAIFSNGAIGSGNGAVLCVNNAPEGRQAAYVYNDTFTNNNSYLSQAINFSGTGNYLIRFFLVRANPQSFLPNDVEVRMDGTLLRAISHTEQPDDVWRSFTVSYTCPGSGNHTLSFGGTRPQDPLLPNGLYASCIDGVQIVGATTFRVDFNPSATGPRTASLSIANNDSTANPYTITLTGTGVTPLEAWRLRYFGSTAESGNTANLSDFDGDGLANLLEFAFGLDPTLASSAKLPAVQNSGGNLFYSFPEPPGIGGITYGAEWSTTLQANDWHTIADTGVAPQHLFSVPIAGQPALFLRLRITAP